MLNNFHRLFYSIIQAEMEQEMTSQKEMIEKQRAEVLRLQTEYEKTKPPTPTDDKTTTNSFPVTNGVVRKREPSLREENNDGNELQQTAIEADDNDPTAEPDSDPGNFQLSLYITFLNFKKKCSAVD